MKNNIYIVYIALAAIVLTAIYQKWVKDKTLRELYQLRNNKDDKEFVEKLDSGFVKFMFNDFTRNFMKLNYFIDRNNDEEVKKLLHHFSQMKLNENDRIALYSKLFGYYIDKKDNAKTSNMRNKLVEILKSKKDDKSVLLLGEVEQTYRIYVEHDISMIDDLLETFNDITDVSVKSVLAFRIAKLYHYAKNEEKVKEYLSLSINYSSNQAQKDSLEEMLNNMGKLD